MDRIERFVISVLVANHSGVLSRVSGMFTRRGFNIDTLTVGETESPEFSRITISTHCDRSICNQIVKQLEKMYDVKTVKVMKRDQTVIRELLLIKINNVADKRQDIMSVVQRSPTIPRRHWSSKSVASPLRSTLLLSFWNPMASWKCAAPVWSLLKEAAHA